MRHRLQPNGRAVLELSDDGGDLVALLASTQLAMVSVDVAWRGTGFDAAGHRRWWALAMGHVSPPDDDEPVVTFARRAGHRLPARRAVVRPVQRDGLWVASATGLYAAVSFSHGPDHTLRRLTTHRSIETRRP